ncbi:uncharacterized protein BX664DRAFT_365497 [Halteromyces radiatus]|uniref:uncharacterized protein n=1 Tax=Halteromyces radiatus TaxID=101107 RepID=UPI00221EF951|nr:uncharacterized protein BX664DRAFT_365497 [Halteromyces radiatus]KAI8089480.1 hypothetical protein BX664DRAFT_365497 [Halteromyces radiatus]
MNIFPTKYKSTWIMQINSLFSVIAPEFVLNNEVTQANDMFSLGCLAYTIHNNGVSMMQTFNNLRTYERKIQTLSSMDYRNIPSHLQDVIRRLLARHPSQRITLKEFQNSKYFDNILVSTMKFLENFPEKTREEKSQFMKGLARVLAQFPERVLKRKILPSLLEELKDHQLLPYTLPNIFLIGQQLSQQEFCDLVLPSLKPVFSIRDPPQNMIVLLDKLDALQEKTPREIFRDDVMPLVYAALENPAVVVQEKALRIVPSLCESLDYSTIKNSLFPRVQALFVQTTVLSVKVSTLICFHSMIKVVDKYTMQEKLVPLLKNIKTKEPAVMLATLAVYDEMGKHLDKEIVATEILPQLWRMSFGPLLNVDQFKKFMRTIRELTSRVEEAHTRHLQEVKSLEEQTRAAGSKTSTPTPMDGSGLTDQGDVSFEALVHGSTKKISDDNDMFGEFSNNTTPILAANGASNKVASDLWSSGSSSNRSSPMLLSSTPALAPTTTLKPISSTNSLNEQQKQRPLSAGWVSSATTSPTTSTFGNSSSPKPLMPMGSPTTSIFPSTTILPPPSTPMSKMTIQQPTTSTGNGPNYSALRGIPTPQQSSNFGLLTPTSTHQQRQGNSIHNDKNQGHKTMNLNSFDPLG